MKPHFRLHITRSGFWWIGLMSPDRTYTIASSSNFRNSGRCISTAILLVQMRDLMVRR
jgi:hypothetical protein